MEIQVDKGSPIPIYRQISEGIRRMVRAGDLPGGFRLPPERTLARSLGVNRSTVLAAYRDLKADGLADAHVGRGTTISKSHGGPDPAVRAPGPAQPLAWRSLAREAARRERDPLLRNLLELTENRDVISLSIGLPAPELLPLERLGQIAARLLADRSAEALLHSPTEGVTSFREALGQLMARRGIPCSPSEILVTSGSQQGLDLLVRAFVEPGDVVVVEEPSYFGALTAFRAGGARLAGVPADADGMRTDLLEGLLERERPKLIYTLPTFQNPSGAVMSLSRRRHLLELAYRFRIPIVEDDPYGDLRYDGEPLPPLRALDSHGYVIYLSSFSKVLFPGLRLGWLSAPRAVIRETALIKQAADLHSSTFGQCLIDRFLRGGHFASHLADVRTEYARRREAMLSSLEKAAMRGVSWARPEGGFYVWCRFPGGISQAALLSEALHQGVSFLPGAACYVEEPATNEIRLNFSSRNARSIREGVRRLAAAAGAVEAARSGEAARAARTEGTRPIV